MLKDPTAWMDDLEFYMDDENIVQTAAAIEPTLLYGGSKTAAGAWIGFVGVLGGAFGAMTLSSEIRTPAVFVGFLVVAALLLRGLHPLSVRLLRSAVAWLAMLAFFWTALLGFFAILGARIQSTLFAYAISVGCGAFIGMMYGALTPGVTKREDLWMSASFPLAPVSSSLATYLLRRNTGDADTLAGAVLAGALAGGLFSVPMGALLGRVWDESHGLAQMGLLYLHNETFASKALAYFDRAIALDPGTARYYTLRGVAWSMMDEPQRASTDWDKASALTPDDPEPDLNRGADCLRRGVIAEAIRCFETALEKDQTSARAHRGLGMANEHNGDLERAIECYDQAVSVASDDARAYANRGAACFKKGEHERALRDCTRAIELDSRLSVAYVIHGQVLTALGRTDDAVHSYRHAISLEPEPSVQEEAVRGLEALGEEGRA
jgi:Flp pilus assembly protein TadD